MKPTGKNLLILSSYFPDKSNKFIVGIFVKRQLECLKTKFKRVDVIALIPHVPKIVTDLGIYTHRKKQMGLKDYSYSNVHVHFIYYYKPPIDLPIGVIRKYARSIILSLVDKYVKEKHMSFDIMHAHFTDPAGYIGVKLKERYNKPIVITVHEDSSFFEKELKMKDQMLNYAWRNADMLIRVNKKDIPKLRKFNKRVVHIPNGFDESHFHPRDKTICRKKLNLPQDKKILLSISGLIKQKGHKYAIRAMKNIVEQDSDVLYYIGGSGELRQSLEEEIQKLDLCDNVKLLGFIQDNEMPLWVNACDLFILPSLNEGNPTVMFEVLGCGRPFIGTKVGGIPEIITDDNLGRLVEPKNSDELANTILSALKSDWNYGYISDYAKQFSWKNIAKQIIKIYEKVM